MLDKLEPLADPRVSGRSLFALKRLAEALAAGLLTLNEVKRGAKHISPRYGGVFDVEVRFAHQRAVQVVTAIEIILQSCFPARFRVDRR